MKRLTVFILLILCTLTVVYSQTIQTKTNNHFSMTFDEKREFSWYNKLPLLPIVFSSSAALPEGQCKNQAKLYRHKLETFTLWAVQMFDASTKYPDGILAGNMKHLGNFDSCYNLHATVPNEGRLEDIHGRYCLIELSYGRLQSSLLTFNQIHLEFDSSFSAWESVEYHGDFRRVHRNKILLAICVPASCSAADVEVSLKQPLDEFAASHGLYINTSVQSKHCTTRHEQSFSHGDFIYWGVILMIGALILGGSWYDNRLNSNNNILSEDISYVGKFFLCFSIRRNYNSIFHQSTIHNELECIHSIRVLFMVLVILGHRTMQYFGYPIVNSSFLEYLYTIPLSMFIFNCIVIVDGFLAISGLLLSCHLFDNLTKTGRINFTTLILIRFLRLTPVYMLIVFFNVTTLPKLGSGPFWEARIGLERDNCLNNWWTHLLYINNYVNPKNLCMFLTWYLAVDFHLYTMGLFVIYAVWRWPRLKLLIVTGITIIGFTGPFIITYKYDSQPTFLGLPWLQDVRQDEYFTNRYIKTHMRIGVYMIGIIAGLIIQRHKSIAWKIPKMLSRLLFIIMILLCITSVLLLHSFYDPNVKSSSFKIASYSVLHRLAFVLGITGIVVLLTVGNGLEYCRKFLSPQWIVPWARLTYGSYLVHNVLQIYSLGITRAPRYVSFHNTFSDVTFDVVFTFLLSLLLSIMVEGPFRQLEKVFLTRGKQGNVTSHTFPEESEAGLIEVISPSPYYYPDLSKLRDTLGDDHQRVIWRSKQNLDFAFLMSYAQTKGTFYTQLEDDILAKKNFITTMKSFALQKISKKENWFVLDFCQLGFIGKMFKCVELSWLIQFFLMFHNDKPVDWLLDHLISTKVCSLDKDSKHCKMAKAELWLHYKPSLFQHIGTHSSLKGKVQKLKDKQFGKITLYYAHENPDATVETQIKPYKQYTLYKAYKGESFFWGLLPQPGDHLKFKFAHPIFIKKYLFRSGNAEHPSDRFYNTTVEVLPESSTLINRNNNNVTEDGYVIIGKFDALGVAQGTVDQKLGRVTVLRLTVHSESDNWAILSEIHIVENQSS